MSRLGGSKDKPTPQTCLAPLPKTERGFGIHLTGTLKGSPRLLYGNGPNVIIRSLDNPSESVLFSGHKADVNIAKFSPNGEWIASGDCEGNLIVWAAKTQVEKNTLRCCKSILDIDWSGDNQRIIAVGDGYGGGSFAKVFMWDSSNAIGEITNVSQKLLSCAFKQSRPFKIAVVSEEKQMNFYAGPPFKFDHSDKSHTNYPNCVRYSPDDSQFVTVGSDRKIVFYDGKEGTKLREIDEKVDNAHEGSIYSVSWSPDGTQLLTSSGDKTCKIWDVASGSVIQTFTFGGEISDMQVSCLWLGDYLISASLSGAINYLDADNPSQPKLVLNGHQAQIDTIDVSPNGSHIYSADRAGNICDWDVKDGDSVWFTGDGHGDKPIVKIATSCDGAKLYSVGYDNKLFVSDTASRTIGESWADLDAQPTCLASASQNPDLCAVGNSKGILFIISDGRVSSQTNLGFVPSVLTFSPDDSELVIGGQHKKAHIFAVSGTDISLSQDLGSHTDTVSCAYYRKDGNVLITADNARHVFIWDRNDFSKPLNPAGWQFHQARITGVACSNDSSIMVTCSADEMMIRWPNAAQAKPKPSKRLKTDPAHKGGVIDLKILDDNTIVTVGGDRAISLWNIQD